MSFTQETYHYGGRDPAALNIFFMLANVTYPIQINFLLSSSQKFEGFKLEMLFLCSLHLSLEDYMPLELLCQELSQLHNSLLLALNFSRICNSIPDFFMWGSTLRQGAVLEATSV